MFILGRRKKHLGVPKTEGSRSLSAQGANPMPHITRLHALSFLLAATTASACSPQVDTDYSGEPLATIRGALTSNGTATAADVAVLWFSNTNGECSGPLIGCSGGGGGDEGNLECVDACGPAPVECNAQAQAVYGECVEACGWEHFFEILWELCVDAASGERVSVQGDFPAAFTLDLYQPPPEEALLVDDDGLRMAYGWFIVADPEAETISLSIYDQAPPESIIGGSGTHALVYAADPIPADSIWGQFFGGSFEPGYHILDVIPGVSCDDLPDDQTEPCIATADSYAVTADDLATEISVELASFVSIDWPGI